MGKGGGCKSDRLIENAASRLSNPAFACYWKTRAERRALPARRRIPSPRRSAKRGETERSAKRGTEPPSRRKWCARRDSNLSALEASPLASLAAAFQGRLWFPGRGPRLALLAANARSSLAFSRQGLRRILPFESRFRLLFEQTRRATGFARAQAQPIPEEISEARGTERSAKRGAEPPSWRKWCARRDSNPRPLAPEANALSN